MGMIGCDSKVVVRGEDDGRWLECEGWGAEIERKVVGCFVLIWSLQNTPPPMFPTP